MAYLHKRYQRHRNPQLEYRFYPQGDLPVLRLLKEYRFLDVNQLSLLLPRPLGKLRYRLQKLYQYGLVDRPRNQRHYINTPGPTVYALGNLGADKLAEYGELARGRVNWQKKNAEVGLPYMEHIRMIGRFRATLTLAARDKPNLKLRHWQPEGEALNTRVLVDGDQLPIRPDGFCQLESLGRPKPFHYYLLEADRSTMTVERFLNKVIAYWLGRKQYQHQLDIPNYSVLTTTISPERADHLRQATSQVIGRQKGSPTFLFTCEKNYGLDQPDSILNPIWYCPTCPNPHALAD